MKIENKIATQTDLAFMIVMMNNEKQIEIRLIINHFFEKVKYPNKEKGRDRKTIEEKRLEFAIVE